MATLHVMWTTCAAYQNDDGGEKEGRSMRRRRRIASSVGSANKRETNTDPRPRSSWPLARIR
eukprot:3489050-Alexandrium_andersonii.AAC.1